MENERAKILEMVSEGKITAEEGAKLLSALHDAEAPRRGRRGEHIPRWFRIRVTDTTTGHAKINMNLPFSLVEATMNLGARFAPAMDELDWEDLVDTIRAGMTGKIIDIEDDIKGEKIEVFVD